MKQFAPKSLLVGMPIVVAALSAGVTANDISGHWIFTMDPDFRGNPAVVDCTLKQNGRKLVARCGEGQDMPGTVSGRKITFRSPSPQHDKTLVATFEGDVNPNGTIIHGTWHLVLMSGTESRDGKFAAQKK